MRQNLVSVLFVKLLDYVYSVVGVKVVDKLLGNLLGGHIAQKLAPVILVELHEHIGGSVAVQQLVQKFSLVNVQLFVKLGNVGGVQLSEFPARRLLIACGNDFAYVVKIFRSIFFHFIAGVSVQCW